MTIRYLTNSELLFINGTLLNDTKILSGEKQIRAAELLDAAIARPAASVFGEDAYPTLREKVAALFHSVVRNHPFADGNKRTATIGALFMFRVNGAEVVWQPEEALTTIVDTAEGRRDQTELAAWFSLQMLNDGSNKGEWEANAARDMETIHALIAEQRWLLDELEKR